ncbi:MAG TPA: preprotein translocase subunit SecG [Burkholderiaceae bacterium]|nr:preprotein translocase subunit SecG [Burkholderiaceae bacterium]
MQIWMTLVLAVQLLSALAMIGLVLVQHGKGADMGASFGSGASGSLFGATGSANFLSRSTAVCATLFFACTLALAFMNNSTSMQSVSKGGSVLDAPAAAASAPATPAPANGAVPAAVPSAVPAPAIPASAASK